MTSATVVAPANAAFGISADGQPNPVASGSAAHWGIGVGATPSGLSSGSLAALAPPAVTADLAGDQSIAGASLHTARGWTVDGLSDGGRRVRAHAGSDALVGDAAVLLLQPDQLGRVLDQRVGPLPVDPLIVARPRLPLEGHARGVAAGGDVVVVGLAVGSRQQHAVAHGGQRQVVLRVVRVLPDVHPVGRFGAHLAPEDHPHALAEAAGDYVSFIALVGSLFVISSGIVLEGDLRDSPATNTGFLAFGAVIASVTGDPRIFVSGGTEHRCQPGQAPIAVIVRVA